VLLRHGINLKTRIFTWAISTAGTLALLYSIYRQYLEPVRLDWMLVLIFTVLLSWRAEVWIPGVRSKITLTDTFIYIGALMLGPWAATVLASIDGLAKSPRGATQKRAATVGINMAAMNLAVLGATFVAFKFFGRLDRLVYESHQIDKLALALGVIALTNYLINTVIVAVYMALYRRRGVIKTWRENYLWTSPAFFIGAVAAGLISKAITVFGFYSFVISLPVMLLTYGGRRII
jgi:hypothetical protein